VTWACAGDGCVPALPNSRPWQLRHHVYQPPTRPVSADALFKDVVVHVPWQISMSPYRVTSVPACWCQDVGATCTPELWDVANARSMSCVLCCTRLVPSGGTQRMQAVLLLLLRWLSCLPCLCRYNYVRSTYPGTTAAQWGASSGYDLFVSGHGICDVTWCDVL
jgi:hypothetical protein